MDIVQVTRDAACAGEADRSVRLSGGRIDRPAL
jgi:hypothetical protein